MGTGIHVSARVGVAVRLVQKIANNSSTPHIKKQILVVILIVWKEMPRVRYSSQIVYQVHFYWKCYSKAKPMPSFRFGSDYHTETNTAGGVCTVPCIWYRLIYAFDSE